MNEENIAIQIGNCSVTVFILRFHVCFFVIQSGNGIKFICKTCRLDKSLSIQFSNDPSLMHETVLSVPLIRLCVSVCVLDIDYNILHVQYSTAEREKGQIFFGRKDIFIRSFSHQFAQISSIIWDKSNELESIGNYVFDSMLLQVKHFRLMCRFEKSQLKLLV